MEMAVSPKSDFFFLFLFTLRGRAIWPKSVDYPAIFGKILTKSLL